MARGGGCGAAEAWDGVDGSLGAWEDGCAGVEGSVGAANASTGE